MKSKFGVIYLFCFVSLVIFIWVYTTLDQDNEGELHVIKQIECYWTVEGSGVFDSIYVRHIKFENGGYEKRTLAFAKYDMISVFMEDWNEYVER